MKVLVLGQGGREHAIVKALGNSPSVEQVIAVPGNDGMAKDALCQPLNINDPGAVQDFIGRKGIDLVVVGPEAPLVAGIADSLREMGVEVFGPSKQAAQLEGSKIFCKEFMMKAKVPTAKYEVVKTVEETMKACENFTPPYVLKADGLCGGKGVVICQDQEELKQAACQFFDEQIFGEAGQRAILEQFQPGWELSYHILTNGKDYSVFPLTQDHKRIGNNDMGPNTGGMGTVGPLKIDPKLDQQIREQILDKTVAQLQTEGFDYRGVIFVGVMVTEQGPTVLEYNVRFGDPETQVMLPLLDGDWGEVVASVAKGRVPELAFKPLSCSCVVLAAEGYPASPIKGTTIEGDVFFETPSSYFLHAGTKKDASGEWQVNGGRVLSAVGIGSTVEESLRNAYEQAGNVSWLGMQMRQDIGQKVLNQL